MTPRVLVTAIAAAITTLAFTQAPPVPNHFQAISVIVGKTGTMNSDGSYRINVPRNDVKFTNSAGMAIPADMGLVTYIAFSGSADRVLAVGDVAMLDDEIDRVIDALHAGNYEVVALHNHMTTEHPRLFYMHFQVTGRPSEIAQTFRSALRILGTRSQTAAPPSTGKPKLDTDALAGVFGSKPQLFPSGVVRFANPRKDIDVTISDLKFTPGMGVGSWAAFYACECGLTMVMGDTCCVRADLQSVVHQLRKAGIHITAIHNHILGGSREIEFLHYEGEGDSLKMAAGIKACWMGLGAVTTATNTTPRR